jgi:hypothetical protein
VEERNRYAVAWKITIQLKLNDLMTLPASGLWECKILGWTWPLRIPVLACIGVRILFLIEVTKGVVDLAVFALIRTDCSVLVVNISVCFDYAYCKGANHASFGDLPAFSSSRQQSQELAASPIWVGGQHLSLESGGYM